MSEENKEPESERPEEQPDMQPEMDISTGILTIEKAPGRRKCPKCGNDNKNMIKESIDKENIIMDYPRVYGKKYLCGE